MYGLPRANGSSQLIVNTHSKKIRPPRRLRGQKVGFMSFDLLLDIRSNQYAISNQLHDIHESIDRTNDLLRQLCTVMFYIKVLLEQDR